MANSSRNRFYLANVAFPLVCAVAVFLMFDISHLDIAFSNLFFDPVAQLFPIGESHTFEQVTHKWTRIIPDWTGELAIIGSLLSFLWPRLKADKHSKLIGLLETTKLAPVLRFSTKYRRDFLFVVFAFAISTGFIHYFKSHTSVYCPVETTLYGGEMEKQEWFETFTPLQRNDGGRCWPAGHASSGFTMLALYFVARRNRWRFAKAVLYFTLLLGFVYGTTRVLQGWHYMSHTFWAALVVWFATLPTALAFYGRAQLEQPPIIPQHAAPKPAGTTADESNQP
ncbi:MAG: phosphatase PAP2 family protein [Pseudomonas sp.]